MTCKNTCARLLLSIVLFLTAGAAFAVVAPSEVYGGDSKYAAEAGPVSDRAATTTVKADASAGRLRADTVRGVARSGDSGAPLPGVNILVQGTTIGTSSDRAGRFALQVPSLQDTLVFSFVGYEPKEVPINGRTEINVTLAPDALVSEELVVTALSIERTEESIGYATQEIEGDDLARVEQPNVINNLNGKVAGLTVYNSTDFYGDSPILLRGERPLIVVDGIPNENANLWSIDASNIKSINVLKGPSAAALYGSLGRRGAVLIETKRGATDDGGIQVAISSTTTFQTDFLRVPEKQTQYGSGRNGTYRYVDGSGGGPEGSGFSWGPRLDERDPSTESGFVEIVQYNSPIDPETGERIPTPWLSRGEDNIDDFTRTGIISNNDVSISVGHSEQSVRVALSNKAQRGIIPNTSLQMNTLNLAGTYNLGAFSFDASLNYNRQDSDNVPEIAWASQGVIYNITQWMGANIDINDLKDYWVKGQEGYQQRHYSRSFYNNPYFVAHEYNRGFYRDVTSGQLSATYDVTDEFSVIARGGVNYFSENRTEKEPKSFVRNFQVQQGNYRANNRNNFNTTANLIASYEDVIADDFFVAVRLGGENYYSQDRSSSIRTDGLVVPDLYNISNSINQINGGNFFTEYKKSSAFGIANLNWKDAVFLEVSGRNDWVSTLPLENNSFFYPAVNGSVVLSEVLSLPAPLSLARLRGSWAVVSNADYGSNYAHLQTYSSGINWQNNSSLSYPGQIISPDLRPETSATYELGTNLGFFEDRLGLEFTFFNELRYNNITSVPVSDGSGYNSRLENANEYRKRGVEFVFRGQPFERPDFGWRFLFNAGRSITRLMKVDEGENIGFIEEGDRIDRVFRTVWQKSPDGEYIIGENGFPIRDPFQRFIGNASPDWTLGLQNDFYYHGFSLGLGIDGRIGGLMESKTIRELYWSGTHPDLVGPDRYASTQGEATYVADGVVVVEGAVEYDEDGTVVEDTRVFAPNENAVNYEDYFVNFYSQSYGNNFYEETFVKLREVSLSYQIPEAFLARTALKGATVSVVGRNLLLFTSDIEFVDPDTGSDFSQTPSMRSFGINLNARF